MVKKFKMNKLLLAGATIVAIALNPAVRKHDPILSCSCNVQKFKAKIKI